MNTIALLITGIVLQASNLIDSKEAILLGYTQNIQLGREHKRPGDYSSDYSAESSKDGSRVSITVLVRDRAWQHPWDAGRPQNTDNSRGGAISGLPIAGVSVHGTSGGPVTGMTSVYGPLLVRVRIQNSPRREGGRMERNALVDASKGRELVEGMSRSTIAAYVGKSLTEASSLVVNGKQVNAFKTGSKTFLDWADLVAAKTGSGQANTRLGTWSGKVGNHSVVLVLASDKIKVDGTWHNLNNPVARKGQAWLVSNRVLTVLPN